MLETLEPSSFSIESPWRRPACAAGPPGTAEVTVTAAMLTAARDAAEPDVGEAQAAIAPNARQHRQAVSIGVANDSAVPLPAVLAICELTPITRPVASSSGPPAPPGFSGWSVWITLSTVSPSDAGIWCWRAATMPLARVRSTPNGLPIASVGIPDADARRVAQRKRAHVRQPAQVDLQSIARSAPRSTPTTLAARDHPALEVDVTPPARSAPATTW